MEISPACLKCGCAMKIISLMQILSRPNCHSNQLFPARLLLLSFIQDLSWGCAWLQGEETREILEALRKVSRGRASLGEQRRSQGLGSARGWGRPSFLKRLWPGSLFPARSEAATTKGKRKKAQIVQPLACLLSAARSAPVHQAALPEHPPTHLTQAIALLNLTSLASPNFLLPELEANTGVRASIPRSSLSHHV